MTVMSSCLSGYEGVFANVGLLMARAMIVANAMNVFLVERAIG